MHIRSSEDGRASSRATAALSRVLPWAGAPIAVLIFALVMTSSPKIAAGAFYLAAVLAAVLVAGSFCRTQGVVLTALWCACLALLASYLGQKTDQRGHQDHRHRAWDIYRV